MNRPLRRSTATEAATEAEAKKKQLPRYEKPLLRDIGEEETVEGNGGYGYSGFYV